MKTVIYVIEDNQDDMKKITEKLNEYAGKYKEDEFEFIPLEGTLRQLYMDKNWKFYEPEILDRIRGKLSEESEKGNMMGLLLDVLLTKEDIEYSLSKYYPRASIAREIYSEFHEKMPVYMITNISMFGTQSDIIMGVNLSDSYIPKEALWYPFDDDVKAMFDKYRSWTKCQTA